MARLARIGGLARELGVSTARLRRLSDLGVIPSERSTGGHRVHESGAVRSALSALDGDGMSQTRRWEVPDLVVDHRLSGLREDEVWHEMFATGVTGTMTQQAGEVSGYVFTEMLNNAIDHSGASDVRVAVWAGALGLRFEILDRGRGALPNLQEGLGLTDVYDALGELSKGKTTTDPDHHTGDGIFSSKAVDVFTLESGGLRWSVDNVRDDQAVGISDVVVGTRVRWEIDPTARRPLSEVFRAFTDEDHEFDRTITVVALFGLGVRFVSRSEAKRVMRGLERFRRVELDFAGVEEVGQGFVDEALRVWPSQHAGTVVTPTRMVGPVDFMVRRGLPRP